MGLGFRVLGLGFALGFGSWVGDLGFGGFGLWVLGFGGGETRFHAGRQFRAHKGVGPTL